MQTFHTNAGRQDLHTPNTNLTKYEKGVALQLFNHLPCT